MRAVHWMQNLHDEFCFFFSFQRSVPWSLGFGVRLKSRRQTAAPALEAVDAVVFHWLQWMQWLHWPQWMQWLHWLQWWHIHMEMGVFFMEASQGEVVVARAGVSAEVVASPSGL